MTQPTAAALAEARQDLAHRGTGYIPPWHGLTQAERNTATIEASHWLTSLQMIETTSPADGPGSTRRARELEPDTTGRLPGCHCALTGPVASPVVAIFTSACPHHGAETDFADGPRPRFLRVAHRRGCTREESVMADEMTAPPRRPDRPPPRSPTRRPRARRLAHT